MERIWRGDGEELERSWSWNLLLVISVMPPVFELVPPVPVFVCACCCLSARPCACACSWATEGVVLPGDGQLVFHRGVVAIDA